MPTGADGRRTAEPENAIRDVATFLATEPHESDRMMARELYDALDTLVAERDAAMREIVEQGMRLERAERDYKRDVLDLLASGDEARALAERYRAALERIEADDHYRGHPGFDMNAHRLNVKDDCYGCWAAEALK